MRIDFAEPWPEIGNQAKERIAHLGLVTLLVFLKPIAVIVGAELAQEPKKVSTEITIGGHITLP
jgi:hypothetical protein